MHSYLQYSVLFTLYDCEESLIQQRACFVFVFEYFLLNCKISNHFHNHAVSSCSTVRVVAVAGAPQYIKHVALGFPPHLLPTMCAVPTILSSSFPPK